MPHTNCARLSPRREPPPRSPCSNRTATRRSIERRWRSSSSKPRACRASSRTCSRWRAPMPGAIRSTERRCTSTKSWTTSSVRLASSQTRSRCRSSWRRSNRRHSPVTRSLCGRLIGNLLDNAVRHAPPRTTVHVRAQRTGRELCTVRQRRGRRYSARESVAHLRAILSRRRQPVPHQLEGRASAWRWLAGSRGFMEEMSHWSTPHPRARRSKRSCRAAASRTVAFICRSYCG